MIIVTAKQLTNGATATAAATAAVVCLRVCNRSRHERVSQHVLTAGIRVRAGLVVVVVQRVNGTNSGIERIPTSSIPVVGRDVGNSSAQRLLPKA